jgi:hypothetical protein
MALKPASIIFGYRFCPILPTGEYTCLQPAASAGYITTGMYIKQEKL